MIDWAGGWEDGEGERKALKADRLRATYSTFPRGLETSRVSIVWNITRNNGMKNIIKTTPRRAMARHQKWIFRRFPAPEPLFTDRNYSR